MAAAQKCKMILDIAMTILSVILMGGNLFFANDAVHEILGTLLLALWAVHVVLNRRWFAASFKGKYSVRRAMQAAVNYGILICAVFLMISGIMLSSHVFLFLHIEGFANFARVAHLLSSHWYYLFMSAHIGLHAEMISARAKIGGPVPRAFFLLAAAYGVYAFARRGVWKYLFLRQQFFFLDIESGRTLFFADYIAIIILFAVVAHYAAKLAKR